MKSAQLGNFWLRRFASNHSFGEHPSGWGATGTKSCHDWSETADLALGGGGVRWSRFGSFGARAAACTTRAVVENYPGLLQETRAQRTRYGDWPIMIHHVQQREPAQAAFELLALVCFSELIVSHAKL